MKWVKWRLAFWLASGRLRVIEKKARQVQKEIDKISKDIDRLQ